MFAQNEGTTDRIIRVVIAFVIFGIAAYFKSWWGLIGIIPLATAAMGWCGLYAIFGMSTCPMKQQQDDSAA
jgi:hypothetical protein